MSDNRSPAAGGPPPLPKPATAPAQPPFAPTGSAPPAHVYAHPGSGPPPLQVAFPQQQGRPLYALPPELDAEEVPAARGGSGWMLWAVPVVAVLLVGAGAVVFLAVRAGPSRAAATAVPPPPPAWTQPLPPLPAIPPDWQAKGSAGADADAPAAPAPATRAPAPAAPAPPRRSGGRSAAETDGGGVWRPPARLPRERDLDRTLKQAWELGENNGLKTRAMKTLKSVRGGGVSKQPVELQLTGTFPQLVAYLQRLHEAMPHALPVSLEMSHAPRSSLDAPRPLPAVMTLDIHYDPELGTAGAPPAPPGQPALAPALVQVAKGAGNRVAFLDVSMKAAPAPQGPAYNHPRVTVEALATSDVEVARFIEQLHRSDRLAEVQLIASENHDLAGQRFRKCKVQFVVKEAPKDAPPVLNPAAAPPPDVFRFPAALQRNAAPAPAADEPGAAHADAVRDAQKLRLEFVLGGKAKVCTINGAMYRVGEEVAGFTVEEITPSAVTLRRGDERFELRLVK